MKSLNPPVGAPERPRELPPVSREGWLALELNARRLGTGETEEACRACAVANLMSEGRPASDMDGVHVIRAHMLETPLPHECVGTRIALIDDDRRMRWAPQAPGLIGAALPYRERQFLRAVSLMSAPKALKGIAPFWAISGLREWAEPEVHRLAVRLQERALVWPRPGADPGVSLTGLGKRVAEHLNAWRN